MEFQVGETYSGYHFLDVLKRSKNGIEFRVKNTLVGRLEALRALPESAQNDQEQSERFLREMRVHASLIHPNIVTLLNAIEFENHLIVTTELVEGPTVADRLRQGSLPWEDAIALTRQVLAAVAYAHQQQIVHRDISPENIIIGPGGVLKLANFGLAKGPASPRLTQVGAAMGNLKYISPEQIKGLDGVDARSDLYAVGMVLYEMLCGRPAFDLESQFDMMNAHVNQPPVPPSDVNAAVPPALDAVVLRALEKDPAERFQTAAEFEEALVDLGQRSGMVAVEPQPADEVEHTELRAVWANGRALGIAHEDPALSVTDVPPPAAETTRATGIGEAQPAPEQAQRTADAEELAVESAQPKAEVASVKEGIEIAAAVAEIALEPSTEAAPTSETVEPPAAITEIAAAAELPAQAETATAMTRLESTADMTETAEVSASDAVEPPAITEIAAAAELPAQAEAATVMEGVEPTADMAETAEVSASDAVEPPATTEIAAAAGLPAQTEAATLMEAVEPTAAAELPTEPTAELASASEAVEPQSGIAEIAAAAELPTQPEAEVAIVMGAIEPSAAITEVVSEAELPTEPAAELAPPSEAFEHPAAIAVITTATEAATVMEAVEPTAAPELPTEPAAEVASASEAVEPAAITEIAAAAELPTQPEAEVATVMGAIEPSAAITQIASEAELPTEPAAEVARSSEAFEPQAITEIAEPAELPIQPEAEVATVAEAAEPAAATVETPADELPKEPPAEVAPVLEAVEPPAARKEAATAAELPAQPASEVAVPLALVIEIAPADELQAQPEIEAAEPHDIAETIISSETPRAIEPAPPAVVVELAKPTRPAADAPRAQPATVIELPTPSQPAATAVMPAIPKTAGDAPLSRLQLIVGSLVGVCLGVLFVVVWVFIK